MTYMYHACAPGSRYVAPIYGGLIRDKPDGSAELLIYESVLEAMNTQFVKAGKMGLGYMPAQIKTTLGTMPDSTNFIKRDPTTGRNDRGYYAATQAQSKITQEMVQPIGVTGRRRMQITSLLNLVNSFMDSESDDNPFTTLIGTLQA